LISTIDPVVYNFEYSLLIGCVTPYMPNVGDEIYVAIAWDGMISLEDTYYLFVYTEPIYVESISPSVIVGDEEETIWLRGSGMEEYFNCYGDIDLNGDYYYCLTCIFGDIDLNPPVKASYVNSTYMRCKIPPKWKLLDQSDVLQVWTSKNDQVFFATNGVEIQFSCDDNDMCTTDAFTGGKCVHTSSVNCDDNNPCTDDSCIPSTGKCAHLNRNCNDNNNCTTDVCTRRGCQYSPVTTGVCGKKSCNFNNERNDNNLF